jgi:hypothetical protein
MAHCCDDYESYLHKKNHHHATVSDKDDSSIDGNDEFFTEQTTTLPFIDTNEMNENLITHGTVKSQYRPVTQTL